MPASLKRITISRSKIDRRAFISLTVTLLLWASAFAGIRAGLKSYSPGALILLRFLIASFALIIYACIIRLRLPAWRDVPVMFLMGFIGITVYQAGLTFGEQSVTAGTASFLVASVPCFTALFALIFLKERLSRLGWLGVATSLVGVGIISFGGGSGFTFTPGALLVILASFSESIYFILQKQYMKKYSALEMAAYTMWTGTIFMLVFLPQLVQQFSMATLPSTLAIVYMGLFPAAIAYVTWSFTLSRLSASIATSFLNISPLLSSLVAWVWLKEIPTSTVFIGGFVVIMGVLIVNTRGKYPSISLPVSESRETMPIVSTLD